MNRSTPTPKGEYWLMHNGFAQAEGVTNLDKVPPVGALIAIGFPKFGGGLGGYARHITPRGPTQAAHGAVNVAISFGGCVVQPGDLILGDDDGLVALSINRLVDLIDAAEAKLLLEAEWTRRLAAADPIRSIFGLD